MKILDKKDSWARIRHGLEEGQKRAIEAERKPATEAPWWGTLMWLNNTQRFMTPYDECLACSNCESHDEACEYHVDDPDNPDIKMTLDDVLVYLPPWQLRKGD